MKGKRESEMVEPEPKTGGSCARYWFQILGDRSHW